MLQVGRCKVLSFLIHRFFRFHIKAIPSCNSPPIDFFGRTASGVISTGESVGSDGKSTEIET